MSSIDGTTKRRPGRPKGSKNKPKTDILTKEPLKEPTELLSAPEDENKAAVREILKDAVRASEILHSEPDVSGVSPTTDPSTSPAQADFIPGTRRPDTVYLPERVDDERRGITRPCAMKKEYHYVFVETSLRDAFKARGYRYVLYDGGMGSGLAQYGFSGTDMFERTLDNHVRHGDTFLMYIPRRGYDALVAEEREQIDKWNAVPGTELHNTGYGLGVKTYEEREGQRFYN